MKVVNTTSNPILFVTFNDNEQEAIKASLKNALNVPYSEQGFVLTKGLFGNHIVMHYHSPVKGDGAESYIKRVLANERFCAIVMVGIACGANVTNDDEQAIGDILLSKEIINTRELKISDKTIKRGEIVPSGDRLYEFFFSARNSWIDGKREDKSRATVHIGGILSGTPLLNNLEKKKELFALYDNESIGYEMEGTSLFKVCHSREIRQTEWIIVKGISDFGDGTKGVNKEKRQKLASKNAVSFCLHVFSREGFDFFGASTIHSPDAIQCTYQQNDIQNRKWKFNIVILDDVEEQLEMLKNEIEEQIDNKKPYYVHIDALTKTTDVILMSEGMDIDVFVLDVAREQSLKWQTKIYDYFGYDLYKLLVTEKPNVLTKSKFYILTRLPVQTVMKEFEGADVVYLPKQKTSNAEVAQQVIDYLDKVFFNEQVANSNEKLLR